MAASRASRTRPRDGGRSGRARQTSRGRRASRRARGRGASPPPDAARRPSRCRRGAPRPAAPRAIPACPPSFRAPQPPWRSLTFALVRHRLPPALRLRNFALLWTSSLANGLASQMLVVAIGWQVYAIHRDPLDLGLIGLAEFLPLPILALPAGQLADRVQRRLVVAVGLAFQVGIATMLVAITLAGANEPWPFLLVAVAA